MRKLVVLVMFSLVLFSCTNDCKNVSGKFSQFSTSLRYTYLTMYEFKGNRVELRSTSKTGNEDYKSDGSHSGSFKVSGDHVIMNFGGSDVVLNINRSADGCIQSLSNQNGTYEKKE